MIPIDEKPDIEYGVYDATDFGEMAHLLAEVFSRYDPPAVGLSLEEVERLVRLFGPGAASDGLSIIARARPSRDIIGAMLVDDFASPVPEGIDKACAHFGPIGALLDGLDEQYRKTRTVVPGEVLHLFILGVAQTHGGRGIAQTLVRLCLENGERKGYCSDGGHWHSIPADFPQARICGSLRLVIQRVQLWWKSRVSGHPGS